MSRKEKRREEENRALAGQKWMSHIQLAANVGESNGTMKCDHRRRKFGGYTANIVERNIFNSTQKFHCLVG